MAKKLITHAPTSLLICSPLILGQRNGLKETLQYWGVPNQKFTREERQMLNQLKQQAEDVEFEEIQG